MEATLCHAIVFDPKKNLVSIPAIFRNANGSSQTRKRSANRSDPQYTITSS
jgi:hypothetical protein